MQLNCQSLKKKSAPMRGARKAKTRVKDRLVRIQEVNVTSARVVVVTVIQGLV